MSLLFDGGISLLLFPIRLLFGMMFVIKEMRFRWLTLSWALVALHTDLPTLQKISN